MKLAPSVHYEQLTVSLVHYVNAVVCLNAVGSDNVTMASESDAEAVECQTYPPSSLPVIRQSGASSAIDDVTAYVDAAGMATTPVVHGDLVVDMSQDSIQVSVSVICRVRNRNMQKFLVPICVIWHPHACDFSFLSTDTWHDKSCVILLCNYPLSG